MLHRVAGVVVEVSANENKLWLKYLSLIDLAVIGGIWIIKIAQKTLQTHHSGVLSLTT